MLAGVFVALTIVRFGVTAPGTRYVASELSVLVSEAWAAPFPKETAAMVWFVN